MHGRQEPDLRTGKKHSYRTPADRLRLDQLIILPAGLDLQNCTPVDRLSAQDIGEGPIVNITIIIVAWTIRRP